MTRKKHLTISSIKNSFASSKDSTPIVDPYEKLAAKVRQSTSILERNLHIDNVRLEEVVNDEGDISEELRFDYLNPDAKEQEWKSRKCKIWTDECRRIVESGPFKKEDLFRVRAEKNKRGYFEWTLIEKVG
jgi:uncharacterized metal-binding protein